MRIHVSSLLLGCLFLAGCQNDPDPKHNLTYEVLTSEGDWNGEYDDASGTRTYVESLQPSGWRYSFVPASLPFEMFIFAEADCPPCNGTRDPSPDVTINFYVDGVLVKTSTNAWAKGVNSLLYTIN